MSELPQVAEFEHLSQVADAELGVAEELSWPIAGFAALAVHLKWESWLLTIAVAVGAYVLSVYRFRKRAAIAEDSYHHAAGLGKYRAKKANTDA